MVECRVASPGADPLVWRRPGVAFEGARVTRKGADDPGRPSGGGDDDEKEALLRRIHEFLKHGRPPEEDEVEEWGEFVSALRYLREEMPADERQTLINRWESALRQAAPDLALPPPFRETLLLALEAAASVGAAWGALEREGADDESGLVEQAPIVRVAEWSLEVEQENGTVFLNVRDRRVDARFELTHPLVLAHLASDVKGLIQQGGPWVAPEEPLAVDDIPYVRVNAVAGYACGNYDYRGFPAVALQAGYEGEVLALCLFQPQQLTELLHQARDVMRER